MSTAQTSLLMLVSLQFEQIERDDDTVFSNFIHELESHELEAAEVEVCIKCSAFTGELKYEIKPSSEERLKMLSKLLSPPLFTFSRKNFLEFAQKYKSENCPFEEGLNCCQSCFPQQET